MLRNLVRLTWSRVGSIGPWQQLREAAVAPSVEMCVCV